MDPTTMRPGAFDPTFCAVCDAIPQMVGTGVIRAENPVLELAPPGPADLDALLAFELANRAFFERHINARPAAFYAPGGVRAAIDAALADAAADRGYQFLVRDGAGVLVGRVNLAGVKRAHFHSAALGYRIAEAAGGRGYASAAVAATLRVAFEELGLLRVEADAGAANLASQRVLLRNGFVQYGHSRRSFELAGAWHDRLHFECHAGAPGGV